MFQMISSFNLRHSDQREFDWLGLEIFLNGKLGYSSGKFNSGQCFQVQVSFQVFVQQYTAREVCRKCCRMIPGFYGIPQLSHSVFICFLWPPSQILIHLCVFINHSLGGCTYKGKSRNIMPMGNIKTSPVLSVYLSLSIVTAQVSDGSHAPTSE